MKLNLKNIYNLDEKHLWFSSLVFNGMIFDFLPRTLTLFWDFLAKLMTEILVWNPRRLHWVVSRRHARASVKQNVSFGLIPYGSNTSWHIGSINSLFLSREIVRFVERQLTIKPNLTTKKCFRKCFWCS